MKCSLLLLLMSTAASQDSFTSSHVTQVRELKAVNEAYLSLSPCGGGGDREKENTVTCKVHVIMVIIIIVSDRSTRLRQLTNNDNETRYQ